MSLLVAHILVAFADPGQTLQGGRKSSGAVPKPSAQNRLSLVGGVGQATQAQRRVRPSAQPDNPVQPEASRSKQLQLRLELIKERILKKLHMDHEPKNITRHNVNLPEPLANLEDYDIEDYEDRPQHARKNSQVIVMTEQVLKADPGVDEKRRVQKLSLSFRFTEKLYSNSIASAFLWIRKKENSNLDEGNIQISVDHPANNRLVRTTRTRTKGSWLVISLKNVVRDWVEGDRSENAPHSTSFVHSLEVSCTNCQDNPLLASKGRYQPFLVIDILSVSVGSSSRKKRDAFCSAQNPGGCCVERFYVSFEKLNWSNWVLMPNGFYANHCKGSCQDVASSSHHSHIMQLLNMDICCSPQERSPISILYLDSNGSGGSSMLKKDLEDMRVDSCSCP